MSAWALKCCLLEKTNFLIFVQVWPLWNKHIENVPRGSQALLRWAKTTSSRVGLQACHHLGPPAPGPTQHCVTELSWSSPELVCRLVFMANTLWVLFVYLFFSPFLKWNPLQCLWAPRQGTGMTMQLYHVPVFLESQAKFSLCLRSWELEAMLFPEAHSKTAVFCDSDTSAKACMLGHYLI